MEKPKTGRLFPALGIALLLCGMAAGALWDLRINQALYGRAHGLAIGMETFGYYVLYLPALFACA